MNPRLKIIFVGDLNSYSRCWARLRAFKDLGFEVEAINHTPLGGEDIGFTRRGLYDRLLSRLSVVRDVVGVVEQIKQALRRGPPDILWIEKGTMLGRRALLAFRALAPDAKIAFFSEDDMTRWWNYSRAFKASIGLYDVVFTTKSLNTRPEELPAWGARRVHFVYQAFDPHQHRPLELSPLEQAQYATDVGFVGSYEEDRAEAMYYLASNGIKVKVWGSLWERCRFQHPLLEIQGRPALNTEEELKYTKVLVATKINLCFLRRASRDLHTSRSLEIPAAGGFMLAERTDEHQVLFEEGREAEFFSDRTELLDKVRYYLAHEDERCAVAAAGFARCARDYTSKAQVMRCIDALRHEPAVRDVAAKHPSVEGADAIERGEGWTKER